MVSKKGSVNMKYMNPTIEIIRFEVIDVIKTSPGVGGSDEEIPGVDWD